MIRYATVEDFNWVYVLFQENNIKPQISALWGAIKENRMLVDPDTESATYFTIHPNYILMEYSASRKRGNGRSILFVLYVQSHYAKPVRYGLPANGAWEQHLQSDKYQSQYHKIVQYGGNFNLWEGKDPIGIKEEYK